MEILQIHCKYRNEIIVPTMAITPNFDFFLIDDKDKVGISVIMKDGIKAKIKSCETLTIFDLEQDITRLYNVSPYDFLKKWYLACQRTIRYVCLWHIFLEKEE